MSPKTLLSKVVDGKAIFVYGKRALKSAYAMAENPRKYVQTKGPTKTFQQDGHWVEKKNVTPILLCSCGNRYLKTRSGQQKCLRCVASGLK